MNGGERCEGWRALLRVESAVKGGERCEGWRAL